MAIPNGGDLIQNSPSKTLSSSPSFLQGSQSTMDLGSELAALSTGLIGDLYLLSALSRFATAMENFQTRMQISMQCLADALTRMGVNLQTTAWEFNVTDLQIANIFQPGSYQGFEPSSNLTPTPSFIPTPNFTPNLTLTPSFTPTPNFTPNLTPTPSFIPTPNFTPNLNNTYLPNYNFAGSSSLTQAIMPTYSPPTTYLSPGNTTLSNTGIFNLSASNMLLGG